MRHALSVIPVPDGPDNYHRPLAAEGMRQADRLVDDLIRFAPAKIVSSPYLRAVQTVEPLSRALGSPVKPMPALREWDSGLPRTPQWERYYGDSWDDPTHVYGDGESLAQLTSRSTSAVTELAREHPTTAVIVGSHGMFISRALLGLGAPGVSWQFSCAMPMPAIYRLDFFESKLRVRGPGLESVWTAHRWDYP
ncbi:histidine phosphatase family protein [Nocardia sp. NPDC088792]|uniref:histidine phosphatase family protein n=1 Tax=Nocardia sp. NPDC088792 TaxID=3364332 RepID=UPI00380CA920